MAIKPLSALLPAVFILSSCQPAEPEPPARESKIMNYTLLGIWSEPMMAYEITTALKEAGIDCQFSGRRAFVVNVEAIKLAQAEQIVSANPQWQAARIR